MTRERGTPDPNQGLYGSSELLSGDIREYHRDMTPPNEFIRVMLIEPAFHKLAWRALVLHNSSNMLGIPTGKMHDFNTSTLQWNWTLISRAGS